MAWLLILGLLVVFFIIFKLRPDLIVNGWILDMIIVLTGLAILHSYELYPNKLIGAVAAMVFIGGAVLLFFGFYIFISFLILNGIWILRKEAKSLGNMLALLLGIGLLVQPFVITYMVHLLKWPFLPYLFGILALVEFYMLVLAIGFATITIFFGLMRPWRKVDYIIILGCGLKKGREVTPLLGSRIDAAIKVYNRFKQEPMIICSGGKGGNESISEAEAMGNYLLDAGIHKDKIILEDQSRNTLQNMKFSKKLVEKGAKIAFCTSNFHLFRSYGYARLAGFKKISWAGSKTAGYYYPSALIREFIGVLAARKRVYLCVIVLTVILYSSMYFELIAVVRNTLLK